MTGEPRVFRLERDIDPTGVSEVATVADGVVWQDGTVALRWPRASTAIYARVEDVEEIHGADGFTRITWADPQRTPRPPRKPSAVDDDHQLTDLADLARALGGDATSWIGQALALIVKSDPRNRKRLQNGLSDLIVAYDIWQTMTDTSLRGTPPRAGLYLAVLDAALPYVL